MEVLNTKAHQEFTLTEFENKLRQRVDPNNASSDRAVPLRKRFRRWLWDPKLNQKTVQDAAAIALFNFGQWGWVEESEDGTHYDFYYQTLRTSSSAMGPTDSGDTAGTPGAD